MKYTLTITADTEDEIRGIIDNITRGVSTPTVPTSPVVEESVETREDDGETPVDSDGMPFDPEIFSAPDAFKEDGTWRVKRGKAEEAKAAREAFLSAGGDVTPPVVEESVETREDDGGLPGMEDETGLPGMEDETPEPVSLEVVVKCVNDAVSHGVAVETLTNLYIEATGTRGKPAMDILKTNESARAKLRDLLVAAING